MSLVSYLNLSSSSSGTGSLGSLYSSALEQLTATVGNSSLSGKGAGRSQAVTISTKATIAAAAKADAKKTAADLVADTRAALDQHYKTSGGAKPNLTDMSPRALAAIVLNEDGRFSNVEMLSAKAEMRVRERTAFLDATVGDFSLASLQSYQAARLESYAAMSAEERAVHDRRA